MMCYKAFLSFFSLILCCQKVYGSPITKGVEDLHAVTAYLPSYTTVLISLVALLLLAYFILGCVCCPNKSIKALSYQNGFPVSRLNENNFENNTEVTIFPPHSTVIDLQPVSPPFPAFDDKVTFEPLPDILPKNFTTGQSAACSSRPAHFNALLKNKVSLHDWFDDPSSNFPREQLQYLREIGVGWFGRVVEGEATQLCDNEEKTPIIVKILREEASPSEHLHFLHEVRPYRDLNHSNVIKLLGRCLESDPFLLIMEHSTCDLKTYLIKQEKKENFLQDGLMLQMISNIASGLRYMHDKGYSHMDLAAHNCFVCNDNSVKVGDYGISFDQWKSDYYCLGDIALPIRWYAPEILRCSDTTIETKEITREANVWAFGVVLWEILELGKLPYEELTDEEVLQRVLIEKSFQLSTPPAEIICKNEIVLIMKECWKPRKYRPSMEKIESFIIQLYNDRLSIKNKELSFEERWNAIQPRITEISSYTGTESSSLKFENDFSTRSDQQNYSSDNEILSSFEMSFDMLPKSGFGAQLSPSLNVLNGSIDELTENDAYINSISLSCGKYDADTLSNISDKDNFQMEDDKENIQSNNAISEQISAAIRDLDLVLASQPDSSRNSTLQKTKPESTDSEKNKSLYVNGYLKESQNLSKSSDLSNISESSLSNFSERLDQLIREKCSDASIDSDLNGNCKFYEDISQGHSDVDERMFEIGGLDNQSIDLNYNQDVYNGKDRVKISDKVEECSKIEFNHTILPIASSDKTPTPVPDIVIDESPSINISDHLEENPELENKCVSVQNVNQQKTFRFVFKDNCEQNAADTNHQDVSNEIILDLTESLKKSVRSEPLTSTPVKSSTDSVLCFENSEDYGNKNDISGDVFCVDSNKESCETLNVDKAFDNHPKIIIEDMSDQNSNSNLDLNSKNSLCDLPVLESCQQTVDSTGIDPFITANSSISVSKSDNLEDTCNFETICMSEDYLNHDLNEETIFNSSKLAFNLKSLENSPEALHSNASDTFYVSATSNISKDYSKALSDVISPPKGYISSHKENSYSGSNENIENEYLENSKASETVSPPQAFQDDGLAVLNDSYSENKTSFDHDLSTSAECGSSENLDQYLEDDQISQGNISAAKLLETSFPDMESKSFVYESCADFAGNMRPKRNSSNLSYSDSEQRNSKFYDSDYSADVHRQNYNMYKHMNAPLQTYDQMIVEDLDTGEQTIINETYSVCDDFENSGESDEILKINTETDEAIIVDSSEALIGFVPSRSIELLQEFEVIPALNPSYALDDEKESSDSMNIDAYNSASPSPAAMQHHSSPYESPESAHPQPYRNFCLQNEVIEEEITDEIVSPSSFHSSSSYCSNEIFIEEEKMSQSSESIHREDMFERSVLPSMDHLYVVSDDGSKTDVSSSECSPVKRNEIVNTKYKIDAENNHIDDDDQEDVMHSYQPTQSVRWLSDDTLDVDTGDQSPIIIEGREILAGDIIQTCELTAEDIASALNHLEAKGHLHGLTPNHLDVSPSPSPFSSVESSPCRDAVYTPDFESDSEETNSGTSCSSTSGSFECIHNKFKNIVDMSKIADESDKSVSSREQSPMKVFSKTWDCHATPTRGVLVTPEKKFNSMRKSVSFHEEDPQVVFEYPPASDSSEDGYPSDDNNEGFPRTIDYLKYADWDLQAADVDDIEAEEILEIEELDSEPYVRRPTYTSSSVGPLNRPMLYTLTSGFSDEDLDLSETVPPFSLNAPSNSPDEEKFSVSSSELSKLIQSQLKDLADKEEAKAMENAASSQISEKEILSAPLVSVQESVESSVAVEDIVIEELLPDCQDTCESVTVHRETKTSEILRVNSDDDDEIIEEIIIEELSDGDSSSDSFEFSRERKPVVLETDSAFTFEKEYSSQSSVKEPQVNEDKTQCENVIASTPYSENNCENLYRIDEDVLVNANLNDFNNCSNQQSYLISSDVSETPYSENNCENLNRIDKDVLVNANLNDFNNCSNQQSDLISSGVSETPYSENNCENLNRIDEDVLVNANLNDFNNCSNQQSDLNSSDVSETVLQKDFLSSHASSQDILTNFEENVSRDTAAINNINIDKNMFVDIKLESCNFNDIESSLLENPVHSASVNSNNVLQSITEASNEDCHISENCQNMSTCPQTSNSSETCPQTNTVSKEKSIVTETACPNSLSNSSGKTGEGTVSSAEETLSIDKKEKLNETGSVLNEQILPNAGDAEMNQTKISGPSISDSSALTNGSSLIENSFPVIENIAQNDAQLKNSSNVDLAKLSDAAFEGKDKVASIQLTEDSTLQYSKGASTEVAVDISSSDCGEKVAPMDLTSSVDTSLLYVPKIIVTPASESEVEDELEEYLREQLEHFSEPSSQDFSVTSEFSCRPFNDVFGTYVSGESADYIEAFNFEFENGNFFEDYVDDYPDDITDRLCPDDNGRQKRSSSLPLMTENHSDDDSLTMKSDSSLVYDTSKGITRL